MKRVAVAILLAVVIVGPAVIYFAAVSDPASGVNIGASLFLLIVLALATLVVNAYWKNSGR